MTLLSLNNTNFRLNKGTKETNFPFDEQQLSPVQQRDSTPEWTANVRSFLVKQTAFQFTSFRLFLFGISLFGLTTFLGCGTTKWSDTGRTATEQLLITSAMDDVIDEFNFYPLSGRKVYIKKDGINCTDSQYLFTILRQQLAANGVQVKDSEESADYILEIAPGAVGTNRYDLMYGIPKTDVPAIVTGGTSSSIPEIALIKRTDQKAQVKLMMWAYNRKTGTIIWQSGSKTKTAHIRDRWYFGIGPITRTSFNKKLEVGSSQFVLPDAVAGYYANHDEKPSVQSEAIYSEIDQQSLEQLEKIRKEGRYHLQKNSEKQDDTAYAENNPIKADSVKKDDKTLIDKSSGKETPAVTTDKFPAVEQRETQSSSIPPLNAVPSSNIVPLTQYAVLPKSDLPLESPPILQFGDMQLSLESTYVPQKK